MECQSPEELNEQDRHGIEMRACVCSPCPFTFLQSDHATCPQILDACDAAGLMRIWEGWTSLVRAGSLVTFPGPRCLLGPMFHSDMVTTTHLPAPVDATPAFDFDTPEPAT